MNFAHSLLHPDNITLNTLGKSIIFEITIGVNGIVWIKSNNVKETIIIRNILLNAENLNNNEIEIEAMIETILQKSLKLRI